MIDSFIMQYKLFISNHISFPFHVHGSLIFSDYFNGFDQIWYQYEKAITNFDIIQNNFAFSTYSMASQCLKFLFVLSKQQHNFLSCRAECSLRISF